MTYRSATAILCAAACALSAAPAAAETLMVTVRDQNNVGVPSTVYVYKTPASNEADKLVIGETNEEGIYIENHKCETAQIIKARPKSSGEYFESMGPCKQKVAMIVIRRDTPKGLAFNGNVTDVTLPDGTPGLMATWAFIDTNKGESKFSMQAGSTCDVKVLPRLDHKFFKMTGDKLVPFAAGETSSSQVLTKLKTTDHFSAIFPSSCNEAKNKILVLENSLATKIDGAFDSGALLNVKAVHMKPLE